NPPGGNAPKTPLIQNNYGYTFGGPVYIPGRFNVNRSKTFFFWSQEWQPIRQGLVISQGVPTQRMRQGDFSECDPSSPNFNAAVASGCSLPVNPATGQAFPGNIVPVDSNARALLDGLVPLPNNGPQNY